MRKIFLIMFLTAILMLAVSVSAQEDAEDDMGDNTEDDSTKIVKSMGSSVSSGTFSKLQMANSDKGVKSTTNKLSSYPTRSRYASKKRSTYRSSKKDPRTYRTSQKTLVKRRDRTYQTRKIVKTLGGTSFSTTKKETIPSSSVESLRKGSNPEYAKKKSYSVRKSRVNTQIGSTSLTKGKLARYCERRPDICDAKKNKPKSRIRTFTLR